MATPKKMKWTPENDQLLLIKLLETHKITIKYDKIADAWPRDTGNAPTKKAIELRFAVIKQKVAQAAGPPTPTPAPNRTVSTPTQALTPVSASSTPSKRRRVEEGIADLVEFDDRIGSGSMPSRRMNVFPPPFALPTPSVEPVEYNTPSETHIKDEGEEEREVDHQLHTVLDSVFVTPANRVKSSPHQVVVRGAGGGANGKQAKPKPKPKVQTQNVKAAVGRVRTPRAAARGVQTYLEREKELWGDRRGDGDSDSAVSSYHETAQGDEEEGEEEEWV